MYNRNKMKFYTVGTDMNPYRVLRVSHQTTRTDVAYYVSISSVLLVLLLYCAGRFEFEKNEQMELTTPFVHILSIN